VQVENETFLDFSRRTDDLAARLGVNLEDLPEVIGISRASLFCYRTGKRKISGKAWSKLDEAERRVSKSISGPASVAAQRQDEPSDASVRPSIQQLTLSEIFAFIGRLPPEPQQKIIGGLLDMLRDTAFDYIDRALDFESDTNEWIIDAVTKASPPPLSGKMTMAAAELREKYEKAKRSAEILSQLKIGDLEIESVDEIKHRAFDSIVSKLPKKP